MQLVAMNGNEPITTSLIVAEGTDSQHRAVLQLIKQNLSDFEEFGRVAFEMQPFETAGGQQKRTIAVLNREHAMLLMTYMRNSAIVRDFKKRLIKAFVQLESRARRVPELTGPELMAKALLEADSTIKELEARATMAEAIVEESAPIVAYHERFIAEDADVTTIDDFARAYSMSGPAVRKLLAAKKIAFRRTVGSRWSGKKGRMVDECEWRAYAGKPTSAWFELRPQHNAPRLHNGQVRQTLYVKTYKMPDLAEKLGLKPPVDESPGLELKTRNGVQALVAEKEKETGEIPWH